MSPGAAIAIVIQPDFSDCDYLIVVARQVLQCRQRRIIKLGCIVGVNTNGCKDAWVLLRKLNTAPGACKIATDGNHVGYARSQCALNRYLPILVVLTVVEVRMGIDECGK